MAKKENSIFNNSYPAPENVKRRINLPQDDLLLRQSTKNKIQQTIQYSTNKNNIDSKRYAIVVQSIPKNNPPVGSSELEHVLKLTHDNGSSVDNYVQFRYVPVGEGSEGQVIPMDNFRFNNNGTNDPTTIQRLNITPVGYSIGYLGPPLNTGAKIEIDANGVLKAVIDNAPIVDEDNQDAAEAFTNNQGSTIGESGVQSADGGNDAVSSTTTEQQCGGVSGYPYKQCKTAPLTATGQTVTLHPDFWDKIDQLVTQVKNTSGYSIKVGGSIRSVDQQISTRKKRCPEWSLLLDSMTETQIMSMTWGKMNSAVKQKNGKGCSDQTPTGAAYGSSASNHTKGLAVDLTMDVNCPASTSSKSGWQNCRNTSKTFNYTNQYASSFGIKNYNVEPWHWSWNGG